MALPIKCLYNTWFQYKFNRLSREHCIFYFNQAIQRSNFRCYENSALRRLNKNIFECFLSPDISGCGQSLSRLESSNAILTRTILTRTCYCRRLPRERGIHGRRPGLSVKSGCPASSCRLPHHAPCDFIRKKNVRHKSQYKSPLCVSDEGGYPPPPDSYDNVYISGKHSRRSSCYRPLVSLSSLLSRRLSLLSFPALPANSLDVKYFSCNWFSSYVLFHIKWGFIYRF